MKIKTILVAFLVLLSSVTFGQEVQEKCNPDLIWGGQLPSPENINQANLSAIVYFDDVEQKVGAQIYLAPFLGDNRCGKNQQIVEPTSNSNLNEHLGYDMVFLSVRLETDAILNVKLYDCTTDCVYEYEKLILGDKEIQYEYDKDQDVAYGDPVNNPAKLYFYSVAQVGDFKYPTLQEAYNAAEPGETITILRDSEGSGFEVKKDITIDFNGCDYTFTTPLKIEEGVQFYHNAKGVDAVVKKSFTGTINGTYNWGTISSPIANAEIPTATAGAHELYLYDEATAYWRYFAEGGASFTKLESGRGYLYANENDITIELSGKLNAGNVEYPISYTDESPLPGFHMIGNPFAHDIKDDHFTGVTLADGFYTTASSGAWIAKEKGAPIAPMEAVLIKASGEGTLTIAKSPASKRAEGEDNGSIAINVSNGNLGDVAYVSFNEGIGLDKIEHRNSAVPMLSVPVEGKQYAIAVMDKDVTEIPVSFHAAVMGEYTIGAETRDCQYSVMTLVDRQTGIETNLLLEDYSFVATSNDNTERFIIRLSRAESEMNAVDNTFAYISNSTINIDNIEGAAVVRVYDVMGRYVSEHSVYESARISVAEYAKGVYVIHMIDESGVRIQKLLVD